MITCKQLMELDIFHNVKLIAGRKGLDNPVSWVYAKHTKSITPWVHGGEFLLVSGYEYGMDSEDLLELVEEAARNKLSGILIEGGINFKEISKELIDKADEEGVPLFFAKGVISFLDVTRDISDLILGKRYLIQKNISFLDQLFNSSSLSQREINQLFYGSGISPDSYFLVAVFSMRDDCLQESKHTIDKADMMTNFSRSLSKYIKTLYDKLGLEEIYKVNLESVDYLIYADTEEELLKIAEDFKKISSRLNREQDYCRIYLSFSEVMADNMNILNGLHEAYFTESLLTKNLFPDASKSFSDIGSYQMIFHIEDKEKLILYRDRYLKKLYEVDQEGSSQLLETLREYLIQNGNVMQTSKQLFIHRNTLQYRIDKVSTIIDRDINDFNVRRDLQNAFLILDVFPFA